jgi:DeoR/GlpR family transcriptional regulator of sugar metabolism
MRLTNDCGIVNVDEFAEQFGVTASTIRRDLAQLSTSGRLSRTYGGAIPVHGAAEPSLLARGAVAYKAKALIAAWAVSQIDPGEAVLLDAGTTVALIARNLPVNAGLSVTTPSLAAIKQVYGRDDLVVHCLGGRLRSLSDSFVGSATAAALERISFDIAFLGADGVLSNGEICEAEPEQTQIKELMASRSRRVFVVVHSEKLGSQPFRFSARLDCEWTLVTDAGASDEILAEFRANSIPVVVVPSDSEE